MYDYRVDEQDLLAFRARFERLYSRTHPAPRAASAGWVRWALVGIVAASVVVSTSHTIPAFLSTIDEGATETGRAVIATATLVMVELGMLAFAYLYTRMRGEGSRQSVMRNLRRGLLLTFILAVGANLYNVLEPRFEQYGWWTVASFIVLATVAASAPTLAYITGEVAALMGIAAERETTQAWEAYAAQRETVWQRESAKFVRSTTRDETPVRVERAAPQRLPPPAPEPVGSGVQRALDYLAENPEAIRLTVRNLATAAGTYKEAASEAKKIWNARTAQPSEAALGQAADTEYTGNA